MAKITEKKKKSPVRDANEIEVKEVKEVAVEKDVKDCIIEDLRKLSMANNSYGIGEKLWLEEIRAVLNKYL